MDGTRRRPLPTNWQITDCPHCGGTLKFAERIYSFRSLAAWDGVTLHIDGDYEDSDEESDDHHLYCPRCLREWVLPDSISFAELLG